MQYDENEIKATIKQLANSAVKRPKIPTVFDAPPIATHKLYFAMTLQPSQVDYHSKSWLKSVGNVLLDKPEPQYLRLCELFIYIFTLTRNTKEWGTLPNNTQTIMYNILHDARNEQRNSHIS